MCLYHRRDWRTGSVGETESVGIRTEQRAFSRTAGINTHTACTHVPHEHSKGPRSKVGVNLCMGESLPHFLHSVFCVYLMLCVSKGQCRETEQQRRGVGENLPAKSQSVNYLSIQFGRCLPKKAEGSSVHSSKGERGDNLLFKSPLDSHLCLTKCLLPISGLCTMPGCTAYHLLITSQLPDFSLLSVLLSFHVVCFHSILHISSMSPQLSLFLSAQHSPLSSV